MFAAGVCYFWLTMLGRVQDISQHMPVLPVILIAFFGALYLRAPARGGCQPDTLNVPLTAEEPAATPM